VVEAVNKIGTSPQSEASDSATVTQDAGIRLLDTLAATEDLPSDDPKVTVRRELGATIEYQQGVERFLQLLVNEGLGLPLPEEDDETAEGEEEDPEKKAQREARKQAREKQLQREQHRRDVEAVVERLQPMGGCAQFLESSE
jgi:hypothetical protein